MTALVAFKIVQLKVELWPELIVVGLAEKVICGAWFCDPRPDKGAMSSAPAVVPWVFWTIADVLRSYSKPAVSLWIR